MIIDDLYFLSVGACPDEAHTILVVYANAMLARTVALQSLKPVAAKLEQIIQARRGAENGEFYLGLLLKFRRNDPLRPLQEASIVYVLRNTVAKLLIAIIAIPLYRK